MSSQKLAISIASNTNSESSSYFNNLSFAVVGLARNCEKTIRADLYRIREAIGNSKSIVWLVVESDSSDSTVSQLENIQL